MRVVIFGGSGQIGTLLASSFSQSGHTVTVVQRRPDESVKPWSVELWDGKSIGAWASLLEGADVVINLAGRTVNCRYTAAHKNEIMNSRLDSTRVIGEALSRASNPPPLWLQMSTATIYAHRYDAANDEFAGIIGGSEPDAPKKWGFSIEVARNWEKEAARFKNAKTRLVIMRTSIVMNPGNGGAFDTVLRIIRLGLGGLNGSGKQYISWMHEQDFVRAINFIIKNKDIEGIVNMAAPNPVMNKDFMRILRSAWGAPIGLPAMAWMIEIGAALMRSESELVLKSRRVIPTVLLDKKFTFDFPTWEQAAPDLVKRWRAQHEHR